METEWKGGVRQASKQMMCEDLAEIDVSAKVRYRQEGEWGK